MHVLGMAHATVKARSAGYAQQGARLCRNSAECRRKPLSGGFLAEWRVIVGSTTCSSQNSDRMARFLTRIRKMQKCAGQAIAWRSAGTPTIAITRLRL